jgi:cell wall-associated NlpC family hydrolase
VSARQKAVTFAVGELRALCLMGYRGELRFDRATRSLLPHGHPFPIYDCSGLVACAIKAAGGPDMRGTHNAQMMFDECRPLVTNEPQLLGDLAFYGSAVLDKATGSVIKEAAKNIIHVAMLTAGGKVISADGATWGIVDLEVAKAARCAVRLHESVHFRSDFVEVRRNIYVDAVDKVSR